MPMHINAEQFKKDPTAHEVSIHGNQQEIDALLAQLLADPAAHIRVFVASWAGVDRLRTRAEAAGLGCSSRISIHHRTALGCLGIPHAA